MAVKNSQLIDFMTLAIEAGCAYWMNDDDVVQVVSVKRNAEGNIDEINITHDVDGKGWKTTVVVPKVMRAALAKAAEEDKSDGVRARAKKLLNDPDYDYDAEDADVAVQLAIFNDVVFG